MADRKRRAKTGCLTCRQRRVKCDERKPVCERCERANVSCDGYQLPRKVDRRRIYGERKKIIATEPHTELELDTYHRSKISATSAVQNSEWPLFATPKNPESWQRPHSRALEVLGHQQYSERTAQLLFRDSHLYFWRDRVLVVAWDTEYVFDTVVALGLMHRAVIMLSASEDKWCALDNKVTAFQIYANALKKISEECRECSRLPSEILIAVLLLLTYFEVFVGNHTAAFQHLRTAHSYLHEANSSMLSNGEPLDTCIGDLGLVVQIFLPLPLVKFPFRAEDPTPALLDSLSVRESPRELQDLLDIIRSHRMIHIATWSALCNTEDRLTRQNITKFQEKLLAWKSRSLSTFTGYDEFPKYSDRVESLPVLSIPPKAQNFSSVDAALAASVFHCYMGRTMSMLSLASGGNDEYERIAALHTYHILRIVQSTEQARKSQIANEYRSVPTGRMKIGFSPILFLCSQFCYDARWLQFIVEKLIAIGQEGLFDAEAFASALQSLSLFQSHAERFQASQQPIDTLETTSSTFSFRARVISILIPGPGEKNNVAYYVQNLKYSQICTDRERRKQLQIVGKARWAQGTDGASSSVSMEFFEPNHPINQGLGENCLYLQLASKEPIAQEWEQLLGTEALGPHGYFTHLAALRKSLATAMTPGHGNVANIDHS